MDIFLLQLIIGIILFLVIGTWLLKKVFKAKSYLICSMVKSTKIVKIFDKFMPLGKALDIFAELGLILGFGLLAFDFNYARKKPKKKRILLDFFAFIILFSIFYFSFGRLLTLNPLTRNYVEFFSIVFAFSGLAGFVLLSLALNGLDILYKVLLGKKACPGVAPLIPGLKIPGIPIFVPLHGWISLLIILVFHEGFHGILARRQQFTVKSAGMLFLGLLPIGAFVDPDEEQLKKAEPIKSLRVFAAGPAANIFSIIIFVLISFLLFNVALVPIIKEVTSINNLAVEKVFVSKVSENIEFCGDIYESNAYKLIDVNAEVISINGQKINSLYDALTILSANRYKEISLSIIGKQGSIETVNLKPNELGVYGFTLEEKIKSNYKFPDDYMLKANFIYFLQDFLGWLILLSLLVGIVNFIPMNPFDGGRIAVTLLSHYFSFMKMNKEDTERFIARVLLWFVLGLLILNAVPIFV